MTSLPQTIRVPAMHSHSAVQVTFTAHDGSIRIHPLEGDSICLAQLAYILQEVAWLNSYSGSMKSS